MLLSQLHTKGYGLVVHSVTSEANRAAREPCSTSKHQVPSRSRLNVFTLTLQAGEPKESAQLLSKVSVFARRPVPSPDVSGRWYDIGNESGWHQPSKPQLRAHVHKSQVGKWKSKQKRAKAKRMQSKRAHLNMWNLVNTSSLEIQLLGPIWYESTAKSVGASPRTKEQSFANSADKQTWRRKIPSLD